jgi:hypothetical protein
MLGFVSQPIDIVQRSLPAPEVLVLEAVEQFERSNWILFFGIEVGERLDVRAAGHEKLSRV